MANEAANEIRQLGSILERLGEGISSLQSGIDGLRGDLLDQKKAPKETGTSSGKEEKDKLSLGGNMLIGALQGVINGLSAIPSILSQQAQSARSFAQQSGTTFSDAIRIEREARDVIAEQAKRFSADEMNTEVRMESLKRNIVGFSAAMGGMPEGLQINTKKFGEELLPSFMGALNTENFTFSTELVRAMGLAGLKTAEDLKAFRQATGKQTMSSEYLSTLINKNALSFNLYGMSFAKAADKAERLGISLDGIRGAQEAGVANVEGLLDGVNQLNALGATLDFTKVLTLSEFGTPEEFKNYILANVPEEFSRMASTRILAKSGLGFDVADVRAREGAIKTPEALIPKGTEPVVSPEEATAGTRSFFTRLQEKFDQVMEGSPVLGKIAMLAAGGALTVGVQRGVQAVRTAIAARGAAEAAKATTTAAEVATGARAATTGLRAVDQFGLPVAKASQAAEAAAVAANTAKATTAAAEVGFLARTGAFISKIPGASFLGKVAAPLTAGLGVVEGVQAVAADPTAPFMKRLSNYFQGFASSATFGLIGKSAEEIKAEVSRKEAEEFRNSLEAARSRARAQAAATGITTPTPAMPAVTTPPATVDSTARVAAKTEELINTLKALNIPELTNAIKTSEKTLEVNIDGQRVTVPGVGLTGTRYRNDTLTTRR